MKTTMRIIPVLILGTALVGCSAQEPADKPILTTFTAPTADPTEQFPAYPLSYNSCEQPMVIMAYPGKTVLSDLTALPTLLDLELEGIIAGITDPIPEFVLPDHLQERGKTIPVLDPPAGGQPVSVDALTKAQASLVFGAASTYDVQALEGAKIPSYAHEQDCPNADPTDIVGSHDISSAIQGVALKLNAKSRADEFADAVDERLKAIKETTAGTGQTAAVVAWDPESKTFATFGENSMANVILDLAGLTNVYADTPDRHIDLTLETLASDDPEYLVVVHNGMDPKELVKVFTEAEEHAELGAVKAKKVLALPTLWVDNPSSFNIYAAERLNTLVGATK